VDKAAKIIVFSKTYIILVAVYNFKLR